MRSVSIAAWVCVGSWLHAAWVLAQQGVFDSVWNCCSIDNSTVRFDTSKDPPIGRKIELPSVDTIGRLIEHELAKKTLLIAAGPCSDCSLRALAFDRIDTSGFSQVVVLFASSISGYSKTLRQSPKEWRFLEDLKEENHKALNAAWAPRSYLLDKGFRVADLQRLPDFQRTFVKLR